MPNIPQISIGGITYNVKDKPARDDLIKVSETQPAESSVNKLWVKPSTNETVIPTYDEFTELKSALRTVGDLDLIAGGNRINVTSNDVTFAWNADKTACTVNGTNSSSLSFAAQYFLGTNSTLPDGIEPGESYLVSVTSTNNNVRLGFYFYVNGAYSSNAAFYENGMLNVPANTTGLSVFICLRPGQTADNDVISGIALQKMNFDHIESQINELFHLYIPSNDTFSLWTEMPEASYYNGYPAAFEDSIDGDVSLTADVTYQVIKLLNRIYITCPMTKEYYIGQKTLNNNTQYWRKVDVGKSDLIVSNVNGMMLSFGNSIMTGTVFINGARDHRSAYDNAPYGCVAHALGIPQKNVTHNIISDTGLVTGPDTTFLAAIKTTDISGYDYLLTQFHLSDLNSTSYTLGDLNSTAGDGTFVGAVLELTAYINTNNPQCQLILVAPPPVSATYTGDGFYVHGFPCGTSPLQMDCVMHALANREHFIYVDWQDSALMPHYQDYTDGSNLHANNENTYRAMGEYLGRELFVQKTFAESYLRDGSDADSITFDSDYLLNDVATYLHVPANGKNGTLHTRAGRLTRIVNSIVQTIEYYDGESYSRTWRSIDSGRTAWIKTCNRKPYVFNGKYAVLHDTAFIQSVSSNTGNAVISNKNLFHLAPASSASVNGISWTENADGTISLSGTATAKANFTLFDTNTTPLPFSNQYYVASCGREGDKYGETTIGYAMYVAEYDDNGTWVRQIHDLGEGAMFYALPGYRYTVNVKVEAGQVTPELRFAFQLELGNTKTAFVKHQGTTFAVGTVYLNGMYEGENYVYSENPDTDITVTYTDIEHDQDKTAEKDELLFSISDPAQGTETEDAGVVFRRIRDTSVDGSYKFLCDYRSYDTSNMAVFTKEFGFGVRQYSTGNNRGFSSVAQSTTIGNYICVPVYVENAENLEYAKFSITDSSSKTAVFDIKDKLHDGINWVVENLYFATVSSGFNKGDVASVHVRTQASANRAAAVTWGIFHTYDFRPMCTYIFDDGYDNQYTYNYSKMLEYGFRGVYAVPAGFLEDGVNWHLTAAHAKDMSDNGCDIISHTRDHVNLIGLTPSQQKYQMQKAREILMRIVPGRNAYFFAPPNVNMSNAKRYHERALAVMNKNATVIKRNDDQFTLLPNLNPLLTYCWGTNNLAYDPDPEHPLFPTRVHTPAEMKEKIDIAIEYGLWVGFGMHYFVDNASQYYDRDGWLKSDFEEVLDYLAEHSADIDVVTYRQAYDKM